MYLVLFYVFNLKDSFTLNNHEHESLNLFLNLGLKLGLIIFADIKNKENFDWTWDS